ncbi:MAG: hypothetical protein KTR32_18405 [Granulosicoccus sp.]|nr:hypothetical protein [Granulosicoccus sp.]
MRFNTQTIKTACLTLPCLLISFSLLGCASSTIRERTLYLGKDEIDKANPSQLVGVWVVRELNPLSDTSAQTTVVEYRANGTVKSTSTPTVETTDQAGIFAFELHGNWELQGDIISHSNIKMRVLSDDPVATKLGNYLNNRSENVGGTANIYELDSRRMVMVGDDGTAMEYTRQP